MDYKKKYLKYKTKYTNIKNIVKGGTTIKEQKEDIRIKKQADKDIESFIKTVNVDESQYTTKLDEITIKLDECNIEKEQLREQNIQLEEKNKDLNKENTELREPDLFNLFKLFRIDPNQPDLEED